ncbi:MAG TPA: ribose-phosphate diphosphokinase [Candidatus Thermoplasmatota archaeon]|nr:ribose-phosphate diphosphokinase [Candidatus Thermoplasmatota archaeon]
MVLVIAGDGTAKLAHEIAKRLQATVAGVEAKTFPDGEEYVRIEADVQGHDVVVVQTTYPPPRLMRLLLTLNACKENGARRIHAVIPYLAYARQDRLFKPGESLSSRVVAEMIALNAHDVVTIDAHKDDIRAFFRIPITNVSAEKPVADELKRQRIEVVLAPDAGAMPRARAVAQRIGAQFDYLEKKRISSDVVEMTPKNLDVRGKSVCILDDIISTGGTMAKALEQLKRNGARDVVAGCVHGLFIGDAADKLKRAGAKDVFSTNTIESPFNRVSVADVIVHALALKASTPGAR